MVASNLSKLVGVTILWRLENQRKRNDFGRRHQEHITAKIKFDIKALIVEDSQMTPEKHCELLNKDRIPEI